MTSPSPENEGARVPWEFSLSGTVPNEPSEAGASLGRELARFARVAEAKVHAQFADAPPLCDECAFREGTIPNRCASTVMDALKCAVEGVPFFCHKGMSSGHDDPKWLCRGWCALSQGKPILQEIASMIHESRIPAPTGEEA